MNFNILKWAAGVLIAGQLFFLAVDRIYGKGIELESFNPTYITYATVEESTTETEELRVQVSFKATLFSSVKLGYNQRFRWEIYESSAPIHDIDFNPSVFIESKHFDAGYEHESNGLDLEESRSWERLFIVNKYKHDMFFLNIKAWHPFFLNENNGIIDYQGKGEFQGGVDTGKIKLSGTFRINFSKIEASYNLGDFYIYTQVFNGFGPQIIEFDQERHINMVGVALTN